jgi:hypothetical protein
MAPGLGAPLPSRQRAMTMGSIPVHPPIWASLNPRRSRLAKIRRASTSRAAAESERGAPSATLDQIEEHLTREPNYQMYILDPPGR